MGYTMASKDTVLHLQEVWKTYQMGETKVHALQGLNLKIKHNEFVIIMGPSGSGKSTAVNMIGCLDTPTKGKVWLENKDIGRLTESQLAQVRGRKIGFVFQTFNLIPTLTALENVTLPMMFQGGDPELHKQRGEDLLNRVELGDRMHHLPSQLSGGQQQRVAVARALANDPEVILADEPTGNLDSKTGKKIISLLETLHKKEKKTIVMVTHDPVLRRMGTRSIILKDGKIA